MELVSLHQGHQSVLTIPWWLSGALFKETNADTFLFFS